MKILIYGLVLVQRFVFEIKNQRKRIKGNAEERYCVSVPLWKHVKWISMLDDENEGWSLWNPTKEIDNNEAHL